MFGHFSISSLQFSLSLCHTHFSICQLNPWYNKLTFNFRLLGWCRTVLYRCQRQNCFEMKSCLWLSHTSRAYCTCRHAHTLAFVEFGPAQRYQQKYDSSACPPGLTSVQTASKSAPLDTVRWTLKQIPSSSINWCTWKGVCTESQWPLVGMIDQLL